MKKIMFAALMLLVGCKKESKDSFQHRYTCTVVSNYAMKSLVSSNGFAADTMYHRAHVTQPSQWLRQYNPITRDTLATDTLGVVNYMRSKRKAEHYILIAPDTVTCHSVTVSCFRY